MDLVQDMGNTYKGTYSVAAEGLAFYRLAAAGWPDICRSE